MYYRNEHTVYIHSHGINAKQIIILLNLVIMNKRTSTKQMNQLCLFFWPSTNYIHYFETYTSCSHTRKTHLQRKQMTKRNALMYVHWSFQLSK